jgi:cell division protein ZapA
MSKPQLHTVVVDLLDKDYQIACPPEEEKALRASAEYLDNEMRKVREKGKTLGLERIAVMVALNLAHELLQTKNNSQEKSVDNESLARLSLKIERSLQKLKQLSI